MCSKGRVHSWQARASSWTSHKMLARCPCCVGLKLCECNSLETVYREIAADFDTAKNGMSPVHVTSAANEPKYSLSDKIGAKKRSVGQRTYIQGSNSKEL
ncbi:TPA: hypothetical protein ACH3X1_014368 [Trebouxia sp. C0004]